MSVRWVILAILNASLLTGCGLFGSRYDVETKDGQVQTLGAIVDERTNQSFDASVDASIKAKHDSSNAREEIVNAQPGFLPAVESIEQAYRSAYQLLDDPVVKNHILQRLAALELKTAENMDVAGLVGSKEAYQVAIDAYTRLLSDDQIKLVDNEGNEVQTQRDELLYALSKAYSLNGQGDLAYSQLTLLVDEFPFSDYWLEAQFRRGEYLFAQSDFKASARVFDTLLQREQSQEFADSKTGKELFSNARYMAGWSQFKNSRYDIAAQHFLRLLDDKAFNSPADFAISNILDDYVLGTEAFPQADKILDDALRAIALSYAYSSPEEAVVSLQNTLSEKTYAHWVYAELAELFFIQERFADSAMIYGAYRDSHQQTLLAPWFLKQRIAVLQHGEFSDKAWQEKARFSDLYHPEAMYYRNTFTRETPSESQARSFVDKNLLVYLDELASFYHVKGRTLQAKSNTQKADGMESFEQASYWYQQKISAFPQDPLIANTYYLLAESFNESSHLPQAIAAYEFSAYGGHPFDKANDAAYAAIVTYRDYLKQIDRSGDQLDEDSVSIQEEWRTKKIESALLFADSFSKDSRRHGVLADAVKDLQSLQNWTELMAVADLLLVSAPEIPASKDPKLVVPTWLASAQAAFLLEDFAQAESRYESALRSMAASESHTHEQRRYLTELRNKEYEATLNNYASSIYRQAELANQEGQTQIAIDQFQRLVMLAPQSQLRVSAQRDAIVLMASNQMWTDLKAAVPQFLLDFPEHEDKLDMQRRLLKAQVATEEWVAASALASQLATELDNSTSNQRDATKQRTIAVEANELRYAAADYADQAGDSSLAIKRYQTIVNNSRQIDEPLYEAHYRLAGLYHQTNDRKAQLKQYRVIRGLEPIAAKRSERSLYIVADAESKLAELDFKSYQKLKITAPLKKSLAKKQKALEKAVEAYTRTENYAVEKFALLATQRKAQIYADFAKAIMDSERPEGLDDLALEEYDILLEDQAYPFEEKAVELYEVNVQRAWKGSKSQAIKDSYRALAELLPARYHKPEILE